MQGPDDLKPNVVVGGAETVGAGVGGAEIVGAGDGIEVGANEIVGARVGRDGLRHTRHPGAAVSPSDDHKILVDELTATQSGPEEPE